MKPILPFVFAAALTLAGCVTLDKSELAELRRHGISESLYQHMAARDDLSIPDIVELSKRRVPDGLIIHYLEMTHAVYMLRTADVLGLKKDGVSHDVIDYLLQTPQMYAARYGPPFYDPSYYGYQPYFIVGHFHGHHH
jgi:hypothetical protein